MSASVPQPTRNAAEYAEEAEHRLDAANTITRAQRNRAITLAYRDMYRSGRAIFKWSGMAAFASHRVGVGLRVGESLGEIGLDVALDACYGISTLQLVEALAAGNNAVFADLYWQHIAYQERRLADLERIHEDENKGHLYAWSLIHNGVETGNQDRIWEGNEELLFQEQNYVLNESAYARRNERLWKVLSASLLFRFFGGFQSPIPDRGIALHEMDAAANLADPNDRWRWIQESLWPAWKELDSNPEEIERCLKQLS